MLYTAWRRRERLIDCARYERVKSNVVNIIFSVGNCWCVRFECERRLYVSYLSKQSCHSWGWESLTLFDTFGGNFSYGMQWAITGGSEYQPMIMHTICSSLRWSLQTTLILGIVKQSSSTIFCSDYKIKNVTSLYNTSINSCPLWRSCVPCLTNLDYS